MWAPPGIAKSVARGVPARERDIWSRTYSKHVASDNQTHVYQGRFWLPDHGADTVSGELTLAAGTRARLDLDQALTPYLREVDGEKQPSGSRALVLRESGPLHKRLDVHGVLEDGTEVALLGALEHERKVSATQDRQTLRARSAVLGGHVSGEARYTRLRLRLRYLDEWAMPLSAASAPSAASLSDGGSVSVEWDTPTRPSPSQGGELGRVGWLGLDGLPPSTEQELDRRFVTPLASLLSLAVDKDCPPVAIEVATGPDEPWLTVHHSGLEAPAAVPRPWYLQLLPLDYLGLERVATWLDAVERLGPLPPVVARATGGSGGTLETQLLELCTVTEGLHRRLFPESRRLSEPEKEAARTAVGAAITDLEDGVQEAVRGAIQHIEEPSFPMRLLELAQWVKPAVPGVTGQTNKWKGCVTDVRHEFAHRLKGGFLATARIDELIAVRQSLRWFLMGLLLLQTGLEPAELAARFKDHRPYDLFLAQAPEWLPRVFELAEADGGR